MNIRTVQVDPDRLRADFDTLAAAGADRPALGEAHLAARAWFLRRAADAGLETAVDAAGNHSALLRGPPGGRTLLLGSHLDTVPDAGRYDGALGVLAALEVLRTVQDAGLELPVTLEAIDFTDEEGTLVGLLGSIALAGGQLDLDSARGGREALAAGLARAGLAEESLGDAARDPATLAGYLELHIEQGPRLEAAETQIGVVSSIVGARSFRVRFEGSAAHAGTTPMNVRRDAGLAAAAYILRVNDVVVREFPGCVATVGDVVLEPGAFNVVPGRAWVSLEFRAPDAETLDRIEARLLADVDAEPAGRWEPTPLDAEVRAAIADAARSLGLTSMDMQSGAGHDAQALAAVTRSGMIFVPSTDGVSHHPAEHTPWDDCVNGANVLLHAALELSR